MNKRLTILACLLSLASFIANAQDSLKVEKIEVIKSYRPLMGDAIKTPFNPRIPEAGAISQTIRYRIPVIPYHFEYEPQKIKAIAFPKAKTELYVPTSIKLGLGGHLSSLLDIYYNSDQSYSKGKYGVYVNHNAIAGKLKERNFSNQKINVFGDHYVSNFVIDGNIQFDRLAVPTLLYNKFNINTGIGNYKANDALIDYKLNLAYENGMHSKFHKGGNSIVHSDVQFSKGFENDHSFNFKGAYKNNALNHEHINGFSYTENVNWFSSSLQYEINESTWKLHLGVKGSYESKSDNELILPEIYGEKTLIKDKLYYYNGWTSNIDLNNYNSLIDRSPFVGPAAFHNFNRSNPIVTRHNLKYTGVRGSLNNKFDYDLKVNIDEVSNMLLFTKDPSSMFLNIMGEDMQIINFHSEISYQLQEKFSLTWINDYNQFNLKNQEYAWHLPSISGSLKGIYNLQNKILVSPYIFYQGSTYNLRDENIIENDAILDLNLDIKYIYHKKLSLFVDFNNLLGKSYQRWNQFPTYGFNMMGGFSFSF